MGGRLAWLAWPIEKSCRMQRDVDLPGKISYSEVMSVKIGEVSTLPCTRSDYLVSEIGVFGGREGVIHVMLCDEVTFAAAPSARLHPASPPSS